MQRKLFFQEIVYFMIHGGKYSYTTSLLKLLNIYRKGWLKYDQPYFY